MRAHTGVQQVWFVCAPIDGIDQTVVGLPNAASRLWIAQPLSKEPSSAFKLGRADPGAGQIYWALSDIKTSKEVGDLHAFNPAALDDLKLAPTPTFTEIRIAGASWDCRWLVRTRLLGFSANRVIEITSSPGGGFEYQTFDYRDSAKLKRVELDGAQQTTTSSLDIKGGTGGKGHWRFQNQGYVYEVAASAADARIVVTKAGKRVASEPLVAWTIGAP